MQELIERLDDRTAARVLGVFARARLRSGEYETQLTPELRRALAEELPVEPEAGGSEGELARQALRVLAEQPEHAVAIQALIANPPTERYDAGTTILVVTAALIALQTCVKFERKESGKWSLRIEKPSMSDALLKSLIAKLLGGPRQ